MKVDPTVLIVDDELNICASCEKILNRKGFKTFSSLNGREAMRIIESEDIDILVTDLKMAEMAGMEVLDQIRKRYPEIVSVVITGYASIASVVETMKIGAFDYLPKPFTPEEFLNLIERAWEKRKEILERKAVFTGSVEHQYEGMIGKSEKLQEVFRLIEKVAPTSSTVLIIGESGTGKELVARAIHSRSERKGKPFFTLDCGTLSPELLKSELFGHIKGSFTGAVSNKKGIFEVADGGTVFLDEICNVDLDVQGMLLRFIQEREFIPVGSTEVRKVDVRLVFATNRDLSQMAKEGLFREDLYYRLLVYPIILPPLRERAEDIPLLANYLVKKLCAKSGRRVSEIAENALGILKTYEWRGNIRELENVLEWALINSEGDKIEANDLPPRLFGATGSRTTLIPRSNEDFLTLKRKMKDEVTSELEKLFITSALERNSFNITRAAKDVGMQRQNFSALARKYGIKIRD
jgi:DNA-binding NtrC family response regulator